MKWVLIVFGTLAALSVLMALVGTVLPREHRVTSTIVLHQPLDSVWQILKDFRGDFDLPVIVVESTPPRRLVTQIDPKAKAAFGGTWTHELTPESGGTQVRITEAGWIGNPVFRFLARFFLGYYGSLDGYLKALAKRFGETVRPVHA